MYVPIHNVSEFFFLRVARKMLCLQKHLTSTAKIIKCEAYYDYMRVSPYKNENKAFCLPLSDKMSQKIDKYLTFGESIDSFCQLE